jgi:hypothetical protein
VGKHLLNGAADPEPVELSKLLGSGVKLAFGTAAIHDGLAEAGLSSLSTAATKLTSIEVYPGAADTILVPLPSRKEQAEFTTLLIQLLLARFLRHHAHSN